jgi:hypothetical protein
VRHVRSQDDYDCDSEFQTHVVRSDSNSAHRNVSETLCVEVEENDMRIISQFEHQFFLSVHQHIRRLLNRE